MNFLIKFAQMHLSFRRAEIESLAIVESVDLTIIEYTDDSPYCFVRLPSVDSARRLIRRSILVQSIHELWGSGRTLEQLHQCIEALPMTKWDAYTTRSFKFVVDPFQGKRTNAKRLSIIKSFGYAPLHGSISLSDPQETWTVFELWPYNSVPQGLECPDMMHLCRLIANGSRDIVAKYDLKKRNYISTTSMDAELALITANISLAGLGKLFYDPFVGSGSFPIACAHFGALIWGSDIDGRNMRGQGPQKSLKGNFAQYGLSTLVGGLFSADLTNSPMRSMRRTWDGILCDPPYGVREGLRVLGLKDPNKTPWLVAKGQAQALQPDYVPPKKPYSFLAMLNDILAFASETLVDDGRLSFWMPTANDEEVELAIPEHPRLELVHVCIQVFHKWSRRLITYRRIPDDQVSPSQLKAYAERELIESGGTTADELNAFRRRYFTKFSTGQQSAEN